MERAEDLRALERLLVAIRSDETGRLLLVAGDAGVGKTALLRWFCESQPETVRVLWGVCEPLLTPRAFGPLCEVAERTGGELEQILAEGARPYEVVMALVRELRRHSPTVLVLEDLHWADEATLDVLRLLARRVGSVPALVIASYRADELDRLPQLRVVLGELPDRPARMKVAPLSTEAVSVLARRHDVDVGQLYERTGGNPFFVTEVLEAGAEQIPETVRDAVLGRALRLTSASRALLQAVAITPGRVELWLLDLIAGDLTQLEECLASGMLIERDGGVAFRHELAREAIEQSLAPDRRRALHQAALAVLTAPPTGAPDPARLAYHACAVHDAPAVLRWAPLAAARAASSGAHREALALYAQALPYASELSADGHAELLERHADECLLTDELDQAAASVDQALLICREHRLDIRIGNLLCSRANVLLTAGRTLDADAQAHSAVALLEPLGPTRELARAYGTCAQTRMLLDDLEEAMAWGTSAIELAECLSDTRMLAHALNSVGSVLDNFGLPGAIEKLERSLRLAQEAGLDAEAARAFNNLACIGPLSRNFAVGERYLQQGLAFCDDHGLEGHHYGLAVTAVLLDLARGRWQQATAAADHLLQAPGRSPHLRFVALAAIALVRARRGDPDVWPDCTRPPH